MRTKGGLEDVNYLAWNGAANKKIFKKEKCS
jgi:hypothetical protein